MQKLPLLLMTSLLVSQASAETRPLRFKENQEVLSNGKVLSSETLTPLNAPSDTRVHEMFIFYRGEVYLCHLTGRMLSATAPIASCYGSWNDQ